MKLTTKTTAGIRTGCFWNTVLFLTEVLNIEIAHYDQENECVQCKLPSGEILEVFGSKNLWPPFTTTPDWEVIIADVRHRKQKIARGAEGARVIVTVPIMRIARERMPIRQTNWHGKGSKRQPYH